MSTTSTSTTTTSTLATTESQKSKTTERKNKTQKKEQGQETNKANSIRVVTNPTTVTMTTATAATASPATAASRKQQQQQQRMSITSIAPSSNPNATTMSANPSTTSSGTTTRTLKSSPTTTATSGTNGPASTAPPPTSSSIFSTPRFIFHDPPSLFRTHQQLPPTLGSYSFPSNQTQIPPAVNFPPHYAPINLLRLIRTLTPQYPFIKARGAPNSNKLLATVLPDGHSLDFTLAEIWAFYDNPYGHEVNILLDPSQLLQVNPATTPKSKRMAAIDVDGSEVYFVPYLSALVLYEKSADPNSVSSPHPLLQWFERVSPHQRLPLIDQLTSIASCFSPPPSSPLYQRFAPFPSKRILFDLPASSLDLTRSWYAITWYPVLHDPLTTPVLAGSFLLYHSFELDTQRRCPIQESHFHFGLKSTTHIEPSQPSITSSASHRSSFSPQTLSDHPIESDQEPESDTGTNTNGDDADGEMETESETERGQNRFRIRPIFPSYLCQYCGDRHIESHSSTSTASFNSSTGLSKSHPAYLPLLGYLCHRVLPSTWYVQAYTTPTSSTHLNHTPIGRLPPHPPLSGSSHPPSPHAPFGADLDFIRQFNLSLHHTGPTSPAALSLSHLTGSHQPTRLTHTDLTQPLHQFLLEHQHPDYIHMTNTQPTTLTKQL